MNNPRPQELISQMKERINAEREQAIAKIESLARSVDAVRLFVATIANIQFGPAGSYSEQEHGDLPAKIETLSYHLFPFFGLSTISEITPWHTSECIDTLNPLVAMRFLADHLPDGDINNPGGVDDVVTLARMQAEIVRGSAYPEQTGQEISEIQGKFDGWFARVTGISPTRAQAILWAIVRHEEEAFTAMVPAIREKAIEARKQWKAINKKPASQRSAKEVKALEVFADDESAGVFEFCRILNAVSYDLIPVGLDDLADLEPSPSQVEWDSLVNLVGMTSEDRAIMSAPVDVRQKPLFVLPDERVILVDISNALDALWDAFEQVAKSDPKFFERYQRRRAAWLEDRVISCLSTIFPSDSIYQKLTYPDPDKDDGSIRELDAAVSWGPFLVLVEAKAKQFRIESQLGDVGRLRSDLKANVEDAFDQARRAAKYIDETPAPVFRESSSGRELIIQKDRVQRIHLVTVSLHLLAGLATRLSMFQDLGLFQDGEYPFSISIADLETLTQFCEGPDVFLHYVEKRLLIQKESLDIHADELDYFGAYLQTRLQPSRLWERDDGKPDFVQLVGYSAQFDDYYNYKRGDLDSSPEILFEIPTKIKDILCELRKSDNDAARWIAFTILDLSDQLLGVIAKGFADLKAPTADSG